MRVSLFVDRSPGVRRRERDALTLVSRRCDVGYMMYAPSFRVRRREHDERPHVSHAAWGTR